MRSMPSRRTPPPLRVALIGLGTIGSALREALRGIPEQAVICGTLVRTASATDDGCCTSLDALLERQPDVVVECAGHQAVDAYAEQVLSAGHDMLLVSAGALANAARYARLRVAVEHSGSQLLVASGAVGGLDILTAARRAGLHGVHYRSRKPPAAWLGTAAEDHVNLNTLTAPHAFFHGSARAAALQYPRNANVAATIALATLGFDETQVELVADPEVDCNVHEILADGVSGRLSFRIEGRAAPGNPKTSMVTAHSLVNTLLTRTGALLV